MTSFDGCNLVVELQGYPTSELQARPSPNEQLVGGTAMVTFASKDVEAVYDAIKSDDGFAATPVRLIADGPFAGRQSFRILSCKSERLEIMEQLKSPTTELQTGQNHDY